MQVGKIVRVLVGLKAAAGNTLFELAFWHRQFPMFSFWERLARFIFLSIGQFSTQGTEKTG
jgi:hypothetical protein